MTTLSSLQEVKSLLYSQIQKNNESQIIFQNFLNHVANPNFANPNAWFQPIHKRSPLELIPSRFYNNMVNIGAKLDPEISSLFNLVGSATLTNKINSSASFYSNIPIRVPTINPIITPIRIPNINPITIPSIPNVNQITIPSIVTPVRIPMVISTPSFKSITTVGLPSNINIPTTTMGNPNGGISLPSNVNVNSIKLPQENTIVNKIQLVIPDETAKQSSLASAYTTQQKSAVIKLDNIDIERLKVSEGRAGELKKMKGGPYGKPELIAFCNRLFIKCASMSKKRMVEELLKRLQ